MKPVQAAAWIAVLTAAAVGEEPAPPTRPAPRYRLEHAEPVNNGAIIDYSTPRVCVNFDGLANDDVQVALGARLAALRLVRDKSWFCFRMNAVAGDKVLVSLGVTTAIASGITGDTMPTSGELASVLAAELRPEPDLPAETRRAAVAAKQTELDRLSASCDLLQAMLSAAADPDPRPLVERLRDWRTEAVRLQEQYAAKMARLMALRSHRERLEAQQIAAQRNDSVVKQLRTIVELRQEKLNALDAKIRQSVAASASAADVRARAAAVEAATAAVMPAKEALAEAELRLAERETAVVPSGTTASLDQLGQEIVKLSVDGDELSNAMDRVQARLAPYSLSNATTQSLAKTVEATAAAADAAKARALLGELERQRAALREALLRLKISKVEAVD